MGWKHTFKMAILKPGYRAMRAVSPSLADRLRGRIYAVAARMKGDSTALFVRAEPWERTAPALLADLTETTRVDAGTGIQRVVNNIFQELSAAREDVLPVRNQDGRLITSRKYLARCKGEPFDGKERQVDFLPGDRLLLLDSSWLTVETFQRIFKEAHEKGIALYNVVYDLLPIQHPEWLNNDFYEASFSQWQDCALQYGKGILCISRTTADAVADYFAKKAIRRDSPLELHYFHMGAKLPKVQDGEAREEIRRFVEGGTTFLMVGTVEVRKGHAMACRALRKLLEQREARLLIIGRNGWQNEEFKQLLQQDAALREHVLWVEDASDVELHWAYRHAAALIAASIDEGFGLPLVEAAYFGVPILCSDIPIFREVAQGYADYFKVMDEDDLAAKLSAWMDASEHPDSRRIRIYTWKEAAGEILEILEGKREPYRVLGEASVPC